MKKIFRAKICVPAPLVATFVLTQNKGPSTEAHFWNPPPPTPSPGAHAIPLPQSNFRAALCSVPFRDWQPSKAASFPRGMGSECGQVFRTDVRRGEVSGGAQAACTSPTHLRMQWDVPSPVMVRLSIAHGVNTHRGRHVHECWCADPSPGVDLVGGVPPPAPPPLPPPMTITITIYPFD